MIFIYGCSNGIISGNNLNYTYADAIHNTANTNNILVVNNRLKIILQYQPPSTPLSEETLSLSLVRKMEIVLEQVIPYQP